jgi:hypothetical protein
LKDTVEFFVSIDGFHSFSLDCDDEPAIASKEANVAILGKHSLDGGIVSVLQDSLQAIIGGGGMGRASEAVAVKNGMKRLAVFVQADGDAGEVLHIERCLRRRLACQPHLDQVLESADAIMVQAADRQHPFWLLAAAGQMLREVGMRLSQDQRTDGVDVNRCLGAGEGDFVASGQRRWIERPCYLVRDGHCRLRRLKETLHLLATLFDGVGITASEGLVEPCLLLGQALSDGQIGVCDFILQTPPPAGAGWL